ncbi:MAG: hypothetical protein KG003_07420 [Bacteroidetes bacterium]|nr:hypothetical protein [Bacteroidota bacterium]
MEEITQIKCPNCGTSIDVQNILAHQLEDEIKKKYQSELAAERKKVDHEQEKLDAAKRDFEEQRRKENEQFEEVLAKKLKEERATLEAKLKSKIIEEQTEQFNALQKELDEKSTQIKELNRTKAEIEKLKREKTELKDLIEAEAQQRLNETLCTRRLN